MDQLRPFLILSSLAAFTASLTSLSGQSSLNTSVVIEAGYNDADFIEQPLTTLLAGNFVGSNTGELLSVNATEEFGPMTFSAEARASSSFRNLRTYAGGTLHDSFFEPYFPAEGPPVGIENFYNAYGEASFTDTLSYGVTALGYNSRYILNLSGSILGQDAFNYVVLRHANQPVQAWLFSR